MKKLPTYCPLDFPFDADRLHAELSSLRPAFDPIPTTKANLESRARWFPLGDDRVHAEVDHVMVGDGPDGPRSVVTGRVPSWHGVGLTSVPERPETRWGSSRFRRGFDGRWQWNHDLHAPYARRLVSELGMQRVDNVRVMLLPAGGFGPVHVDWHGDDPWEADGLVSLTFLARDGGVAMRFKGADGRLHDVNHPVFFFKDCAPHGVPQTSADRFLLRVNGAMHRERLTSLMRIEEALW